MQTLQERNTGHSRDTVPLQPAGSPPFPRDGLLPPTPHPHPRHSWHRRWRGVCLERRPQPSYHTDADLPQTLLLEASTHYSRSAQAPACLLIFFHITPHSCVHFGTQVSLPLRPSYNSSLLQEAFPDQLSPQSQEEARKVPPPSGFQTSRIVRQYISVVFEATSLQYFVMAALGNQ